MMKVLLSLVLFQTIQSQLILHEQHQSIPFNWSPVGFADDNELVQLTIAVKYSLNSIASLEKELIKRSDPIDHPTTYGKWLTRNQVDAMMVVSKTSISSIIKWLNTSNTITTISKSFLSTTLTAQEYKERVGQPLTKYQHRLTGKTILRLAKDCYLPVSIASHIDILSPSVSRYPQYQAKQHNRKSPQPNPIPTPPIKVTPSILRTVYNLTNEHGSGNASNNTQGIANFLEQYVEPSDLNKFFQTFANNNTVTTASKIVGSNNPSDPGIEAMLDVEYTMGVGQNINTEWWFTDGGQPHDPTDEPWLKWLMAVSNSTTIPFVFTASYADIESKIDLKYANRVNVELMKIGIRGTSILTASGDYGIGVLFSSNSGYHPYFPASSPYVTSVGGTMFANKKTNMHVEQVWNDGSIGGGGGFSNLFQQPTWQNESYKSWYSQGVLPKNASWWNAKGRSYPDVVTLATPYEVVCDGYVQTGTGTSASTPTMAAIVSLLNEHRIAAGKSQLGYLNPLIYKVLGPKNCFRDVTIGGIPGFYNPTTRKRDFGFAAVNGYDPASGWGSPNFPKLLKEVMQLP